VNYWLLIIFRSSSSENGGSGAENNQAQYLIGGAVDPQYYTDTGAFNGSGIALASQSFAEDVQTGTHGSIVMYFQHHTGEIRWMQLSNTGDWVGGTVSEVVAIDAKNNTPLSAVVSFNVKSHPEEDMLTPLKCVSKPETISH
jgi:hypothetical protein